MRVYCLTVRCAVLYDDLAAATEHLQDHHAALPVAAALGLLACAALALALLGPWSQCSRTAGVICGVLMLSAAIRIAATAAPGCVRRHWDLGEEGSYQTRHASPYRRTGGERERMAPALPTRLAGDPADDAEAFLRWAMEASPKEDAVNTAAQTKELRPLPEGRAVTPTMLLPESCLLLAFMAGYSSFQRSELLEQFLGSFRQAGSTAQAVIIHDGKLCSEVASRFGAQCIDFHLLPSHNATAGLQGTSAYQRAAKIAARFLYWEDYLARTPASVTNVLCTDMRDVVFLGGDIFGMLPAVDARRPLLYFAEHTNVLSGEDAPFNRYCRQCVASGAISPSSCSQITGLPMLNCGLLYGTRDGMQSLMLVYARALRATRYTCWDQMLFSMLVWSGAFQPTIAHREASAEGLPIVLAESSAVCTIGFNQALGVRGASSVLNARGGPCGLVHQFDRFNSQSVKPPNAIARVTQAAMPPCPPSSFSSLAGIAASLVPWVRAKAWQLWSPTPPAHRSKSNARDGPWFVLKYGSKQPMRMESHRALTPGHRLCSTPFRLMPPLRNATCSRGQLANSLEWPTYVARMHAYGSGVLVPPLSKVRVNGLTD